MKKNDSATGSISRRQVLQHAVGAVGLMSALPALGASDHRTRSTMSAARNRETFDFGWKFLKGEIPGADQTEFADSNWRTVDLPHDWSIEGPFDEKASSGACGAYLPTGVGWYRKHFRPPDSYADHKLTIEFDGVYENSEVWINGRSLGKRPYGYVPFFYELTPYVHFGHDNVIAVRVDNSRQTNCRWYSGSGIYRHTWLTATEPVHVAQWGMFAAAARVSGDSAMVEIRTRIRNESANAVHCTLTTALLGSDERTVQIATNREEIAANAEHEFLQRLAVDKPHLWSVDDPYLYRVRSTVQEQARVVDECVSPFGIREAVFDADRGFLLNGERVKLNGVCVHHDGGCVGAAVPERIWERRLQILKSMGCNAIRTSHNPFAAEFLDLCDRMGFLVMNEAFDEWKVPKGQIGPNGYSNYFDEWYARDLENFIRRDRNHPCVILWSAGNEIGDQGDPHGAETLGKLLKVFRAEDPTRMVTAGCDHISSEPISEAARPEFLSLLDVVGYNYVDRWRDRTEKYYSIDRQANPRRRFIGTESVGLGGIRGDYGRQGDGFTFSGNRSLDVEQLWKFVNTYDYVAGDFMWTGYDHLGEARWPMKASRAGVLDTCGFRKDGFYFYQSQWTAKPVLHLFPHWNWQGKESQVIPVTCYTNCDTVELFLNDRSLGGKGYAYPRLGMEREWGNVPARARVPRTTSDLHLSWDVPYEAGTLKAIGTRDGAPAATLEISTTGAPAAIRLSVDRETIAADRRDVAHVEVRVVDSQGRLVPVADNEIAFELQGAGLLIGLDNGNPESHESYQARRRRAFNGFCLAIVQSTGRPGRIELKATSPALESANITVVAKA